MNYYDVLGIDKNASQKEIKSSYKKLIKRYHPDLYPGNTKKAEIITRNLNEAYEVLSDPEKKAIYDLSLQESLNNSTYDNYNKSTIYYEEEQKTPSWIEITRKKLYEFIDKKTRNLSSESKLKIIFIIILIAFCIFFISANDFLNYKIFIENRRKQEELEAQNSIYDSDYHYNYYFNYIENQNYND